MGIGVEGAATAVSYRHASGETQSAENVEAAAKLCPVIGNLALSEVKLLLELQALDAELQTDAETAASLNHEPTSSTDPEPEASPVILAKPRPQAIIAAERPTPNTPSEAAVERAQRQIVDVKPVEQISPAQSLIDVIKRDAPSTDRRSSDRQTIAETAPPTKIGITQTEKAQQTEVEQLIVKVETSWADAVVEAHSALAEPLANEPLAEISEAEPEDTPMSINSDDDQPEPEELAWPIAPAESVVETIINQEADQSQETTLERLIVESIELPTQDIEPVENVILALAMAFDTEADRPEELEAALPILEQVVLLPEIFDVASEPEKVLDEKLEELFVELFEVLQVDCSPELIKALIQITKTYYKQVEQTPAAAEASPKFSLPDQIGTREFLQTINHGLSKLKKAMLYLYEIGHSILSMTISIDNIT